jgi:formylglycine-generating enzyme required for sulfatase activity
MIACTGGKFTMGPSDADTHDSRQVEVSGFQIAIRETTADEFARFLNDVDYLKRQPTKIENGMRMIAEGSAVRYVPSVSGPVYLVEKPDCRIKRVASGFATLPGQENSAVNWVTYSGAVAYCEWLSEKTGDKYRLPTEAEWEYAGLNLRGEVQGMPGGVWEWCSDWFAPYPHADEVDPKGPTQPENANYPKKAIRGGEWVSANAGGAFGSGQRRADVKSRAAEFLIPFILGDCGFRVVKEYPAKEQTLSR